MASTRSLYPLLLLFVAGDEQENKWSDLKVSFNVKSWSKLLFKRPLNTKIIQMRFINKASTAFQQSG